MPTASRISLQNFTQRSIDSSEGWRGSKAE